MSKMQQIIECQKIKKKSGLIVKSVESSVRWLLNLEKTFSSDVQNIFLIQNFQTFFSMSAATLDPARQLMA